MRARQHLVKHHRQLMKVLKFQLFIQPVAAVARKALTAIPKIILNLVARFHLLFIQLVVNPALARAPKK